MRDLFVDYLTITQSFELNAKGDAQLSGEVLFFPEFRTFGNQSKDITRTQEGIVQAILENAEPDEFQRRMLPQTEIKTDRITIELEPTERHPTWRKPLELEFSYLFWEHEADAKIAYVPGLAVEVVASSIKRFDEMLKDHILFALNRAGVRNSLFDLALLQRGDGKIAVSQVKWNAYPMTPRERFERSENSDEQSKKVLSEVASQLDTRRLPLSFERDEMAKQLGWMLGGRRSTSVLMVGESGVGKTALIHHLVQKAGEYKLGGKPVYQTSGSKIVAGMTGFGQWQERCRRMVEEAKEKDALIFFGNLFELLQVGQSSASSESLGSFFRPYLIRGEFIAIAECTPQQLALIEQIDPRILDAFRQLKLEPADEEQTLKILKKRNAAASHRVKAKFGKGALERLLGLQKRYSGYSAFPGKAVRFLERVSEIARQNTSAESLPLITPELIDKTFAAETGMPDFLIDESISIDLDAVRHWFGERLKGQEDAVNLTIDTIAAIKARLTRPGKPLASFLFIGPTGVGKTELAKTLAEFFYGSQDRLIRLDMSEYAAPGSAGRLAAGGRNEDEGILTAQMRDQPFSVLLLDEFEKADASVYDLFLQVLGEARLTDAAGRTADFSNAIIILTSNLGAREFRLSRPGFHDPKTNLATIATDHFTEQVKKNFRPEFFNRIDRIVPFLSLSRDAVKAVVAREIQLAEHRDGLKNRNISLIVPGFAVEHLAEIGYDPRYGARPVKRAIEQWLLQPISEFFCSDDDEEEVFENGFLEIVSLTEDKQPVFEFKKASDHTREDLREHQNWFAIIPAIRRDYQRLMTSGIMGELQSERNRLRTQLFNKNAGQSEPGDHQRLSDLNELIGNIETEQARILEAEEQLLLARFHEEPASVYEAAASNAPGAEDFANSLLSALGKAQQAPATVVLVMKTDSWSGLATLARAYVEIAESLGYSVRLAYWKKHPDEEHLHPDDISTPNAPPIDNPRSIPVMPENRIESDNLLVTPPDDFANLAIEISGAHAALYFSREVGVQTFTGDGSEKARVAVGFFDEGEKLEAAWLPESMMLDYDFARLVQRRTWDQPARRMRDSRLGSSPGTEDLRIPWEFSTENLGNLIRAALIDDAKRFL